MNKNEYLELQTKVKELAKAYYDEDTPKVSDAEYDDLMRQIKVAEKEHPDWITKDSITQIIGGSASTKFSKVTHDVPMLSIEDVFDKESVKEWIENVKSVHPDADFTIEEKIDGLSCTLRYKTTDTEPCDEDNRVNYKLVLAETRGNGHIGEDVTENVLQIKDVPHELFLSHDVFGDEFQIRGEIYMTKANFERYNKEHPEKPAANPRNLAAGTLRQKDASLVKERGLSMFIFNVQKVDGASDDVLTRTQIDGLFTLKLHSSSIVNCQHGKGFSIVNHQYGKNFEDVDLIIDFIESTRNELPYDIDGAVIKINQKAYQDDFKGTAKYSAGHIAYKYPQTEKRARLTDIEIGIGRTGKLSFTGVVCDDETGLPLQMCGTEVSRVTLNNMDYIREHHIGIGGVYGIIKSGEIIPKLTDAIYREPETIYEVSKTCPFCGEPIENRGAVDYFCSNNDCSERKLHQFEYFCGRNQMNIDGVSGEMIRFLMENEFIEGDNPSELYFMANEYNSTKHITNIWGQSLDDMEGWGKTSVKKMVDAINKSRKTTFERVLVAQGIPNVGHGQVKLLKKAIEKFVSNTVPTKNRDKEYDYFEILLTMYDYLSYDFTEIEGFGKIVAKNLCEWIGESLPAIFDIDDGYNETFKGLYKELKIEPIQVTIKGADTISFDGLTFCCTGSVTKFKNRDELYAWIENLGGKTTGAVSKKTSYLINNDVNSTSGKNKKAKELGIPIITEEELLAMRKEA